MVRNLNKTRILGILLAGVLATAPVLAEEFHALSKMSSGPMALSETQLATIEGGTSAPSAQCSSGAGAGSGGLLGIPVAVNALNCSNVAVVLQANVSALNIGILGQGSGDQTNALGRLIQDVQ